MLSVIKKAFEYLGNAFELLKEEESDSLFLVVVYCMFICFMTVTLVLAIMFTYAIA